jgi:hypothetical protein
MDVWPVNVNHMAVAVLLLSMITAIVILQNAVAQDSQVIDVYVEGYDIGHEYDVCGGNPTNESMFSCVSFTGAEFENYKGTFEYDLKQGDRIFACVLDITAGGYSCQYDTESSPDSVESFAIDMRSNARNASVGLPEVLRTEEPQNIGEAGPSAQGNSVDQCIMLVMCSK